MLADVISLAQARLERDSSARRLSLALNVHVGAVELILGTPLDEDAVELWLSPDQALELADDLRRKAQAAKGRAR